MRRGHGRSPGDFLQEVTGRPTSPETRSRLIAAWWEISYTDVLAAVSYIRERPDVDPNRIVLAGHSAGGVLTTFAVADDLGVRAAITMATGAQNWNTSPDAQQWMRDAVRRANVPLLLIQAENDFNTSPTRDLSAEMEAAGKPHTASIFPPNGTTAADGHAFCAQQAIEVCWPDISAFLHQYV